MVVLSLLLRQGSTAWLLWSYPALREIRRAGQTRHYAAALNFLVSSFSLFGFRIVALTFHPLDADNLAAARPRPEELPVIKIALCLSLFMSALLSRASKLEFISVLPKGRRLREEHTPQGS